MASRSDLLARLVTALERPGVDGVLGTPDVLDDLLLLGALEGKVVIGSMNRGGLQGSTFELDDRFTAYTAQEIQDRGIDGGKMLTRIALGDPGTVATLEACARAVGELSALGRMAMVEPFWSVVEDGRVRNLLDPDSMIRAIHVASGLGAVERAHLAQAARGRRPRSGSWTPRPCPRCSSAATPRAPRARRTPRGAGPSSCPPSAGSSSAAPCSTRPTPTSPPRSTSPPTSCTVA